MADLWDDPNLTFSKVVLNWLLKKDQRIMTTGFKNSFIDAIDSEVNKEELAALLSDKRIIPDAYLIDHEKKTAFLFEVEDTNPISADKLRKLSEIWFFLDSINWEVRVFLIDRYMHHWSVLPLSKVWHTLEFEDASKRHPNGGTSASQGGETDWEEIYQNLKRSHVLGHDGWI